MKASSFCAMDAHKTGFLCSARLAISLVLIEAKLFVWPPDAGHGLGHDARQGVLAAASTLAYYSALILAFPNSSMHG